MAPVKLRDHGEETVMDEMDQTENLAAFSEASFLSHRDHHVKI